MRQVEAELLALPKGNPRRGELGRLKLELQEEVRAIRPRTRTGPELPRCFMDSAREMLPREMFRLVMNDASRRLREAQAAGETGGEG